MFTRNNILEEDGFEKNSLGASFSIRGRASAFLFLCLLSVVTIAGCGEKPLPAGEQEFSEGLSALEAGDTAQARVLFAKASDNDPGRPWRKLGEARRIELYSSPFGAMGKYLEIISLSPDFDSAYTAYCRLALRFGKPQLAWNTIQLYARNRSIGTSGDTNGSEGMTPASRNYELVVAKILQMRSELEQAESRLNNLSQSFPQDGEVTIALASVLLQQGRTEEALKLANQALDNKKRRDVLTAAINFFSDAGHASKALSLLDQARGQEDPENLWANRLAIDTYLRLGYIDYASFTISQMKTYGLGDGLAFYLNGTIAEARGRATQAKEWYLYSLSIEKSNIELFRDAARAATSAKNFILMEDNMNGVLHSLSKANFPVDYLDDAHLQFAQHYVALRQWRPALGEMNSARSTFLGTPRYELLRAETLYFMQARDSGLAAFARIANEHQDSFEWLRGLALTMTTIGNYDSAKVYLDKALKLQPRDLIALIAKIDVSRKTADTASYAQAVQNLVRTYPQNKRTLKIQTDYYLTLGDNVSALDMANRVIELYPGDLTAYNYAATLAGRRYGSDQGLKYLQDAKERNSKIPAPYRILASYYLRQGAIDSAEIFLNQALKLDPTDEASLLTRGVLLEAKGFPDSAIAVYKQMTTINPFSAEALNNLAWVMANNNIEPAQASNIAREAVALSGGVNGNMHGTLGWALVKEKKFKQANMAFQLAIRFEPQDAFKRFLYGSALEEAGDKEKAVEQFNQALSLGISGGYRELVDQALVRLKK